MPIFLQVTKLVHVSQAKRGQFTFPMVIAPVYGSGCGAVTDARKAVMVLPGRGHSAQPGDASMANVGNVWRSNRTCTALKSNIIQNAVNKKSTERTTEDPPHTKSTTDKWLV